MAEPAPNTDPVVADENSNDEKATDKPLKPAENPEAEAGKVEKPEGEAADAQEEGSNNGDANEEDQKLDDDEKEDHAAYIPRNPRYYMHDSRVSSSDEEAGREEKPEEEANRESVEEIRRSRADGSWNHDRFDERYQRPKTKKQLMKRYGFDIRRGENGEIIEEGNAVEENSQDEAPVVEQRRERDEQQRPARGEPRARGRGARGGSRGRGRGAYRNGPARTSQNEGDDEAEYEEGPEAEVVEQRRHEQPARRRAPQERRHDEHEPEQQRGDQGYRGSNGRARGGRGRGGRGGFVAQRRAPRQEDEEYYEDDEPQENNYRERPQYRRSFHNQNYRGRGGRGGAGGERAPPARHQDDQRFRNDDRDFPPLSKPAAAAAETGHSSHNGNARQNVPVFDRTKPPPATGGRGGAPKRYSAQHQHRGDDQNYVPRQPTAVVYFDPSAQPRPQAPPPQRPRKIIEIVPPKP
ncbi:unnamed protein product, partial [Mesorhabditis spiculigera]